LANVKMTSRRTVVCQAAKFIFITKGGTTM
jgi:hypothetical protein